MENLIIGCRIEEVPFLAVSVRDNFLRDKELFVNLSPTFDDNYLGRYDQQAGVVKELVTPTVLTGEMKKITVRIGEHYNTARTMVNKVEFYAKKAGKSLTVKPSDFGFSALRRSIGKKDDEAIVKGFREMGKHIDNNSAVLEEQGLTPAIREEIGTFTDAFEKDSLDQGRKLAEREKLVRENAGELNTIWDLIREVCDAGKIIAKEKKNKAMLRDYTLRDQLKKVRIMRKKAEAEEGEGRGME